MPAQRKAKAVRAAENKQKARKAVYGYRTSDDVERDADKVLGLIHRHRGVVIWRMVLASFVPIPCPRCSELRGIGDILS